MTNEREVFYKTLESQLGRHTAAAIRKYYASSGPAADLDNDIVANEYGQKLLAGQIDKSVIHFYEGRVRSYMESLLEKYPGLRAQVQARGGNYTGYNVDKDLDEWGKTFVLVHEALRELALKAVLKKR